MAKVGAVTRTDPGKKIVLSRDAHVGYGPSITTERTLPHVSPRVAMSAVFNALNTRKLWHSATHYCCLHVEYRSVYFPSEISFSHRHYSKVILLNRNNKIHETCPRTPGPHKEDVHAPLKVKVFLRVPRVAKSIAPTTRVCSSIDYTMKGEGLLS